MGHRCGQVTIQRLAQQQLAVIDGLKGEGAPLALSAPIHCRELVRFAKLEPSWQLRGEIDADRCRESGTLVSSECAIDNLSSTIRSPCRNVFASK